MTENTKDAIRAWQQVPRDIEELIAGRSDKALVELPGSEGLSLKEVIHHLTEANIVAAAMIIAALGASGTTFDWSWLWPNREWTDRLGYRNVPLGPSVDTLKSLIAHISNIVSADDEMLSREVRLLDSPGAETYSKSVVEIIQMEIDHAAQHLGDAKRAANGQ